MTIPDAAQYSLSLIGPAIVLAALAWGVPSWLGRKLPETMLALGANLAVSASFLWAMAGLGFAVSYALQGVPLATLVTGIDHFAGLGRASALFWGPILLLCLAMQPQHWRPDI
ncbi:MAG: hypothetical protein AAF647_06155 [Pseudomonadota bacterium]